MKTTFFAWISQRLRRSCGAWLGILLCGTLELTAATWIPDHYETVTGTGWVPSWVDGYWQSQPVEGYWDTQTVAG